MKKLIFSSVILISLVLILGLNLVSAELCLGNDGYYHDCDNDRYFDKPNYETSYYYHGKYYPTRDYYYREYCRLSCCDSRCNKDDGLTYKDAEEYKRTIEYSYKNRGVSENIKYTINEKTDINLHYEIPYLRNMGYYANQNADSENKPRAWYSWMYE